MLRAMIPLAAVALVGCGGGSSATAPAAAPSVGGEPLRTSHAESDAAGRPSPEPAPSAPSPPEPTPAVRLLLTNSGRSLLLIVESRSPEPARLAGGVTLEMEGEEGWTAVSAMPVDLRASCGPVVEECVELVEGAELRTVVAGPASEGRAVCPTLAPGRYRAVLTSCGGQHVLRSHPVTR